MTDWAAGRDAFRSALRAGDIETLGTLGLDAFEAIEVAQQKAQDAAALADALAQRARASEQALVAEKSLHEAAYHIAAGTDGYERIATSSPAIQAIKQLRARADSMEHLYSSEHDSVLELTRQLKRAQGAAA